MSIIDLNSLDRHHSGIPTFLLANYFWIKAYYENKTGRLALPENDGICFKEACYRSVYDDFKCAFGVGMIPGDNPIHARLGNKAWREIKKDVPVRRSTTIMKRTEYAALIQDPITYLYGTCLQRLYKSKIDDKVLQENYEIVGQLLSAENNIFKNLTNSGRTYLNMLIIASPLDFLADFLRGTKQLLLDLHSVPERVKEACQAVCTLILSLTEVYADIYDIKHLLLPLHLPGLLSRSDFEEFYYPTYKFLLEELIKKGYGILILFEGNVDRFIDIISETDSDQVIAHFESTNIVDYQTYFKGKRTFISGFYPSYLLKYGSKKECLDAAKQLKEMVKGNDRYIFSTNKVLFTCDDVSYQNLHSVYDYFSC